MATLENELASLLPRISTAINQGKRLQAVRLLRPFCKRRLRIPNETRAELADCLRRVEQFHVALRVLRPKGIQNRDDPRTKTVYAQTLNSLGSTQEAINILESIDLDALPEARLSLALSLLRRWDYDGALPHLGRLLSRQAHLSEDSILAARTYQGISLLFDEAHLPHGLRILKRNIEATSVTHYPRRHLNCLFFVCVGLLLAGRSDEVNSYLARLSAANKQVPEDAAENEQRIIELLLACLEASRGRSQRAKVLARRALFGFRASLLSQNLHYRAILVEYLLGVLSCDRKIFEKLFVGVNYPCLKERLKRNLTRIPHTYRRHLKGENNASRSLVVDLAESDKAGRGAHRALLALASNFYCGLSLLELHEGIFEGESFNVSSSPARVKQTLSRLRHWLKSKKIPLLITAKHGFYKLAARESVELIIPVAAIVDRSNQTVREVLLLRQVKIDFKDRNFSATDVAQTLAVSASTAQRLLLSWIADQAIEKTGSGPKTNYALKRSNR